MSRHSAKLGTLAVLAAALGCSGSGGGDDDDGKADSDAGTLELVGHSDLGARGMNSAIAVAGDVVYVGSRIDNRGIAIVDVSDPAHPTVVGEIGPPHEGIAGMSSRELRVIPDLNLLVVLNLKCAIGLHGCGAGGEVENLKLFDITDRRAPVWISTYPITGTTMFLPRSPHEFFLWRDATKVLVYVTAPPSKPSLEVVDITNPAAPTQVVQWDISEAGAIRKGSDDILHSIAISDDGTRAYLSHQLGGLLVADTSQLPAITLVTPPSAALHWDPPGTLGPHSAVRAPGRDVLVATEEIYPMPFGTGCPWGHMRMVDISNPAAPSVIGEYKVPENDGSLCSNPNDRITYTAHNATVTHDVALITWYAAGLQVVDISDPTKPVRLTELRPEPLPSVAVEDPGVGGVPIEMWSYPVIQNGLIYVVDVRNGLYILRYHGKWQEQIADEAFLEGNSNL
ncbi:MAG: LVIVD repeat-containing protein [Kofleriaceae bacterium]